MSKAGKKGGKGGNSSKNQGMPSSLENKGGGTGAVSGFVSSQNQQPTLQHTSTMINQANGVLYDLNTQPMTMLNVPINNSYQGMQRYGGQNMNNVNMNGVNATNMNNGASMGSCEQSSQGMWGSNIANGMVNGNTIQQPSGAPIQGQSQGQGSVYDLVQTLSSQLNTRLSTIEQTVSKLGNIEASMSSFCVELSALKRDNVEIKKSVNEMDRFCQSISDFSDEYRAQKTIYSQSFKNIESENNTLKQQNRALSEKVTALNKTVEDSASSMTLLKDRLLDLESRSMQSNLVFFGLAELVDVEDNKTNCERLIKDFMKNELTFEEDQNVNVDGIEFDRVHRLGRRRYDRFCRQVRPRPIIAAFKNFSEKEIIRKCASSIKTSRYSIREQFPREVEDRRKVLYPLYNKAKANPLNSVKMIRDKLFVNGKTILHTDVEEETGTDSNTPVDRNRQETGRSREPHSIVNPGRVVPWGLPQRALGETDRPRRSLSASRNRLSQPTYMPNATQNIGSMFSVPTHNGFEALNNLSDRETSGLGTYIERGKKKASSPVSDQTSPKKLRDFTPQKSQHNDSQGEDNSLVMDTTEYRSNDQPPDSAAVITGDDTDSHEQSQGDQSIDNGEASGQDNSTSGTPSTNEDQTPK